MGWIKTISALRDSSAINHFISKARSWNNCLEVVLRCPTRHHSLQQLRAKNSANQNHQYLLFPFPVDNFFFCNFMGLEMITSISYNLSDL